MGSCHTTETSKHPALETASYVDEGSLMLKETMGSGSMVTVLNEETKSPGYGMPRSLFGEAVMITRG